MTRFATTIPVITLSSSHTSGNCSQLSKQDCGPKRNSCSSRQWAPVSTRTGNLSVRHCIHHTRVGRHRGTRLPPRSITRIIAVAKAYTTRVGAGPLPTEIREESPAQKALQEVAATTGRIRRGGWFDAEVVKFAAQVNGADELFLTKLDILSQFETIKVGVGYEYSGRRAHYAELNTYELAIVEPFIALCRAGKRI